MKFQLLYNVRCVGIRTFLPLFCIISLVYGKAISQHVITYYVSPSGSDLNPGSPKAPFKSIQHCIDQWDGINQFICNCSGTFNEELEVDQSGPSSSKKNKIIAWDTDDDGQLNDETFILDGENTRNIGLTNKLINPFTKPDNVEVAYMQFKNFFPDSGCIAGGNNMTSFIDLNCPGGSGCNDWWIHHCSFENIGNKSPSEQCNAESHYIAIKPTNTARLIIEQNSFKNIFAFLIRYMDGPDIKFINNYVEIATTGIKGWGENLDRITISGNTFACDGNGNPKNTTCLGQNAINLSNNAQNGLISNNIFYDCVNCIHLGTDEDFGTRPNTGHIVENNVIHWSEKECNKFSAPILIDDCTPVSNLNGASLYVSNITFRNNIINYAGVHTTSSQWNQGAAIELQSGHPWGDVANRFYIYNNTVKGFYWGLRFTQCRIGSVYPPYQLNSVYIQNNIFTDLRDAQYTMSTNGIWVDNIPQNIYSDYNSFYGKNVFKWETNKTLSLWQALGYDRHSTFCKPLFTDTINLRLAKNDQCAINRGFPAPGFTNDIDNNLRPSGKAWDLGADEFDITSTKDRTESNFKLTVTPGVSGNYLSWTLAKQDKEVKYIIEKSINGESYEEIGRQLFSAVHHETNSAFTDIHLTSNPVFYRLKIEYPDKTSSHTPEIKIVPAKPNNTMGYKLFPNPAKDILNIASPIGTSTLIKVYNELGICLLTKEIDSTESTIDISHLPNGVYVVQLNKNEFLKLIKAN